MAESCYAQSTVAGLATWCAAVDAYDYNKDGNLDDFVAVQVWPKIPSTKLPIIERAYSLDGSPKSATFKAIGVTPRGGIPLSAVMTVREAGADKLSHYDLRLVRSDTGEVLRDVTNGTLAWLALTA